MTTAFLITFGVGMAATNLPDIASYIPAATKSRPDAAPSTPTTETEEPLSSFPCTVASVHDGDTFRCTDGTKVRLAAIAARELDETCRDGHPCPDASGGSARLALRNMALGEELTCEPNGTTYGRIAAWCWTPENVQLNCEMVEKGYALRWARHDRDGKLCSSQ